MIFIIINDKTILENFNSFTLDKVEIINYTNYEIKKYSFVSTLEELKIILEESKTHKSIFFSKYLSCILSLLLS